MGGFLAPAQRGHPWTGWSFSAGWDNRATLNVTLMRPELVVEVGVDVVRAEYYIHAGHSPDSTSSDRA
nr:hypothetical protein [Streptomyces sp. S1D4-11]